MQDVFSGLRLVGCALRSEAIGGSVQDVLSGLRLMEAQCRVCSVI